MVKSIEDALVLLGVPEEVEAAGEFQPRGHTGSMFAGGVIGDTLGAGLGGLGIREERVSEAAGVNSAAGSFGLSFGLAMAGGIMLAVLSLSFTNMTERSDVIPPAQKRQIADTLEDDAQVMSNIQLERLLAEEPADVRREVLDINADARDISLRVALLVPILAGLLGVLSAVRMRRLPDPEPSTAEGAALV